MFYTKPVIPEIINIHNKECIIVNIKSDEYQKAEEISKNRWSNEKTGTYGEGLCNTTTDPYRATRTGILGEIAFSKITNLPVDDQYKKGGDKYDFIINNKYKIDVKFAIYDRGENLILDTNKNGEKIPLNKHIYVFGYIQSEDKIGKNATAIITGFLLKENVKNCKIGLGKGYTHLNYVVPKQETKPITKLIKAIDSITNSNS